MSLKFHVFIYLISWIHGEQKSYLPLDIFPSIVAPYEFIAHHKNRQIKSNQNHPHIKRLAKPKLPSFFSTPCMQQQRALSHLQLTVSSSPQSQQVVNRRKLIFSLADSSYP
uniref:Uncharacterized protein n=1 Tax=Opuntia streptacantha TaxID=393608 RepID=A0A7C8ZP28_OPUST